MRRRKACPGVEYGRRKALFSPAALREEEGKKGKSNRRSPKKGECNITSRKKGKKWPSDREEGGGKGKSVFHIPSQKGRENGPSL